MSLQDLISAHLAGEQDEAGRLRFEAILRKNPAARLLFAAALRQEVLLSEVLRDQAVQRPARRRVPWIPVAAAAAVLAAAIGILALWPGAASPVARIERAEGTVWISSPEGRTPAAAGAVILAGQGIEAEGADSAAAATMEGGVRIRLEGGARATLSRERVFLDRGSLAAEVARRLPGRAFVVATPQVETRVLGTKFTVTVEADRTLLEVAEGRVLMTRTSDESSVEVGGGQFAVAAPGVPLESRPLPAAGPPEKSPVARILSPRHPPSRRHNLYRLTEGCLFYGDRGYEITRVPPALRGHWGIMTCAEDSHRPDEEFLVFEVLDPVDVYVGYDFRAMVPAPRLPTWMDGFRNTGMRIFSRTAGDTTYHVYRKRFPAGQVALGGNHQGGDTGARVNYLVIVAPAGP